MSEQVNPVSSEERESSSDLLLSVESLDKTTKLYATDTADAGADSDVTGADTDATDTSDTDGTDMSDSDGTDSGDSDGTDSGGDGSDVTDTVKDALGMDSDGKDTVDADGSDSR